MSKTALITGATDGIGKNLAYVLAEKGYTIHVLGLGEAAGQRVLNKLHDINPDASHELYIVDLSTIKSINKFLDEYTENHDRLDLLILNANATTFKNVKIGGDGIDVAFIIGYVSRYMFSVCLNSLLLSSDEGEVVHIGGATMISNIRYDNLDSPNYSVLKSTAMGFMANNLLTYHAGRKGFTTVPYRYIEPGIVNTNTVKSQGRFTIFVSKLMGMIEPDESAKLVVQSILSPNKQGGEFYTKTKERKPKKTIINGEEEFLKLMRYSEKLTGAAY